MAKQLRFRSRDAGVSCSFSAKADTKEALMAKIQEHAAACSVCAGAEPSKVEAAIR